MLIAQISIQMNLLSLFLTLIAVTYAVSVIYYVVKGIIEMKKWTEYIEKYQEKAKMMLKEKESVRK